MMSTDSVTVTTLLSVEPGAAFRLFTDEVDLWWRGTGASSKFFSVLR